MRIKISNDQVDTDSNILSKIIMENKAGEFSDKYFPNCNAIMDVNKTIMIFQDKTSKNLIGALLLTDDIRELENRFKKLYKKVHKNENKS